MTTSVTDAPFSVEDLLSRSKAAAESKSSAAGKSKIQQMLEGTEDIVEISGVQKQLALAKKAAPPEPYTEQDWYLKMKANQLRVQLSIYSNMGGDIANSAMDAIEDEIKGILQKQQAKLAASQKEAAAKQKALDAAKAKEYQGLSADDMLAKANGTYKASVDPAVQKLLDSSKKTVNTSA